MLRLDGHEFPVDGESLAAALEGGLREVFGVGVIADLDTLAYPSFPRLSIDLSGGRAGGDRAPEVRSPSPGPDVAVLSIRAQPLHAGPVELAVRLKALDVRCGFGRDEAGRPVLALSGLSGGNLELLVARASLEAGVREVLEGVAKKHGVQVIGADLDLRTEGEGAVLVDLLVTARRMLKARVRVLGRTEIDDRLVVRVAEAETRGEGLMGAALQGQVAPAVKAFEGRDFALGGFLPAGLVLENVRVEGEGDLRITADLAPFG